MQTYLLDAVTDNPHLTAHAINISGLLADNRYMSQSEAEARIPAVRRDLAELAGYGDTVMAEISLRVVPVEREPTP